MEMYFYAIIFVKLVINVGKNMRQLKACSVTRGGVDTWLTTPSFSQFLIKTKLCSSKNNGKFLQIEILTKTYVL
jgi:hypothetical protein